MLGLLTRFHVCMIVIWFCGNALILAQLRNMAVRTGDSVTMKCQQDAAAEKESHQTILWKYGKMKSEINPIVVTDRNSTVKTYKNMNCTFDSKEKISTCFIKWVVPDNAGFYKCDYATSINTVELVVIDSQVKCTKVTDISQKDVNIICEANSSSSQGLKPTLIWDEVKNARVTISPNPPNNYTIRSVATLHYPQYDKKSLTCRLVFRNSSEIKFDQNFSTNIPEFTSSCNTEPIIWNNSIIANRDIGQKDNNVSETSTNEDGGTLTWSTIGTIVGVGGSAFIISILLVIIVCLCIKYKGATKKAKETIEASIAKENGRQITS